MDNAPCTRGGYSSVWTGSEMIIWGGAYDTQHQSFWLNSGARYNPALDKWTTMTTTNAPEERSSHSAVWTGTEMIIWGGGNNTNQALNTGARYNPFLDTWVSLTTTNAPVSRCFPFPSTVWTGSKMIIWGGTDGLGFSTIFNDGGIYDPLSDTWKSMTTVGAPIGRYGQTVIWTGSKMIVWGGRTQTSPEYLNTGGIYDPSNDTWTPLTTSGAPSPRIAPTGVWTGSKMIVWGGGDGSGWLNTGGLYDPVSNSWETMSIKNVPQGRCDHCAIWTGTPAEGGTGEMIIWGGGGSPYFTIGGRYLP
jgi:hypothetical protein